MMWNNIWIFLAITVCGANTIAETKDVNRIVNGNIAADFQFPYMVSIQEVSQLNLPTRGHRCGGALVTYQHVLTAASCLFRFVNLNPVQLNVNELRIFAGSAFLINDTVQDRVRFIANLTIHPQYVGQPSATNNIAIITLQTPFSNSTVTPIGLPAANFMPADFTLCTVAGWGGPDSTAVASTQLRFASKYIYNQNLCTTAYTSIPYINAVISSMVCATSFDTLSAGCFGDEGNSLVCNGTLTGILFLTNNCEVSPLPELYTRVSNYTTWVRSITGASCSFRPDYPMLFLVLILVQVISFKIL